MVAVFVLDKRLRCDFINAVAETLTGLSPSQARDRPFDEVLWPTRSGALENSGMGRLLAAGIGGEGEESILDNNGVRRPFSFRVAPLGTPEDPRGAVVELVDLSGETGTARALRESEQRLRLAVEATGIGIWDVNAVTGDRRWSPEFRAILGLPPDARPDTELFSALIHPADRERVDQLYREAYNPGSPEVYQVEFRIRRADDNSERWVAIMGRVVFDATGHPLRGVGTLRDINERRRHEEMLREREERLRVALVAGRMGTWRYDLRTGEQQWDETQHRLFGIDPSVKPTRDLFLSLVHPEDVGNVAFDETVPLGTYLDSEFRIRRYDTGEIRWISAQSVARADATGRPAEMIGVNRDMTAQKEAEAALRISEERHRLAMETNAVGTWDYDLASGEHKWSEQFKVLWGLAPDAPADPALLYPLVEERHWDIVRRRWDEARDPEKGGRIALEYPVRRANDGAKRWLAFAGQIFFDEVRRTPLRAVGIVLDVTDRRETEERQRMILRELNHRVKNSLAVVQAIVSQTLRMSKPGEAFARIQARLMAVARTHDFLNLSNWGGVSLVDLLKGELEPYAALDGRVALEGVPIALDSKSALALGLTFHELATNAAKYGSLSAPEGRLDIRWSRIEGDGRTDLVVTWSESGGPPVRAPRRAGFGSRLIEGTVQGNLNGSVSFDYARTGLRCQIVFPLTDASGAADPTA